MKRYRKDVVVPPLPLEMVQSIVQIGMASWENEEKWVIVKVSHQFRKWICETITFLGYPCLGKFKPFLSLLINIRELDYTSSRLRYSDLDLLKMPSLETLTVGNNMITGFSLISLTGITSLDISSNSSITDGVLKRMTNLVKLNIVSNSEITGLGISTLTNLLSLKIRKGSLVTGDAISVLTNLTSLSLGNNNRVCNRHIHTLTNLTKLNLDKNPIITDHGIDRLTNLKKLVLTRNKIIGNGAVAQLSNLTHLDLRGNEKIFKDIGKWLPENCTIKRGYLWGM